MLRSFSLILVYFLSFSGCVFIDESIFPGSGKLKETVLFGEGEDKILLIDISGPLSTGRSSGFLASPSLPARVKEELMKAEKDPLIRGIVLRVNTPGGTVTASDVLFHEFRQFKQKRDIPLVTSIMDLGTSGGYYVAMATDHIFAHPSTITGSIGVIMLTVNAQGLMEKVGMEASPIVSGPKKSMGSPFRRMDAEERAIFQSVIDNLYARFLTVVEEGRPNLNSQEIKRLADGRIYTAESAQQHGLIDKVGYLDEAIAYTIKAAKLQNATVVTYTRGRPSQQNIYSKNELPQVGSLGFPQLDANWFLRTVSGGTPQMMYMWMP